MKRYRLLKDLPFAKAGEKMEMWSDGTIAFTNHPDFPLKKLSSKIRKDISLIGMTKTIENIVVFGILRKKNLNICALTLCNPIVFIST